MDISDVDIAKTLVFDMFLSKQNEKKKGFQVFYWLQK